LVIADPKLAAAAALLQAAGYVVTPPMEYGERAHLSPREEQVAALLLDGASNKAIARALEISVHTAKFHVTAVLDKVGARNRADAVAIIMREGLIAL
jgi:DNA-binding CsgD family transcriptional regulator